MIMKTLSAIMSWIVANTPFVLFSCNFSPSRLSSCTNGSTHRGWKVKMKKHKEVMVEISIHSRSVAFIRTWRQRRYEHCCRQDHIATNKYCRNKESNPMRTINFVDGSITEKKRHKWS